MQNGHPKNVGMGIENRRYGSWYVRITIRHVVLVMREQIATKCVLTVIKYMDLKEDSLMFMKKSE